MENRLRSSLNSSAETFLSTLTKLGLKSTKPTIKTLIHSIDPSSNLSSSLPFSLLRSIHLSISSFQNLPEPSSLSPPTKRPRRSNRKSDGPESSSNKVNQGKEMILRDLQVFCHVSYLCVTCPKNAFLAEDLLPSVRELHDNLVLFESDSVLLSEIASLCEEWWKEELPGRETLIAQSLPFLLSRSLTVKKKVDVHRVYVLRDAFTMFDFEDESIEDLKLLLIRCLISPLYLKCEEGRKFISFMFGLSGQLLKDVLAMIRAQIPFGRKSMLEGYADIVFRAWKVAEGEVRDEIENGFLEGLIEGAIHASSAPFAASVRRVLGGFVNQRTIDGVEKLLYRLAEPLIYRSLQVANSNVRQNALHLLLDMFPLEDPDATKEVKDTMLDKQFFLLEKLLLDDCPSVRAVAVEGSCRILYLFWEIISTSTITKIIKKVINDMAHDTCNEVRLSVVNGIIFLLRNPQSHELLKVLLPRLGHLILDSVLFVRVAVADLLLLIRDVSTFQFNKVVDMDTLMSTLENDQSLVAQKITKLLLPSYFPSKLTPEEACNRCFTLMKRSPLAGTRFCEFALSEGASLKSLSKLLKVFISLVLSPDKLNPDLVEGLLLASSYLCNHLGSDPSYKTGLKELFSGEKLKRLSAVAVTRRAQSSLFNIVFTTSPSDVAGLIEDCIVLITNCSGVSENAERQAEVRSAHKLIMSCDWFDDMFEALARILEKTALTCHLKFGIEMPKQSARSVKRKKGRSAVKISGKLKQVRDRKSQNIATSMFEEEYLATAGVAWQINDLLVSADTRKALLDTPTSEIAFLALKVIAEASIMQCIHCEYMDTSPVMAYTSLALHMTLSSVSGTAMSDGLESRSPLEFNQTMDHLLKCSHKLIRAGESEQSNKLPRNQRKKKKEMKPDTSSPSNEGSDITKGKKLANTVKMLTAILKFIIEAFTLGLVSHIQESCLSFASAYLHYLISNLKQHSRDQLLFKEDLRETFHCLKSSCTYAAKLLNLVLTNISEVSVPPPEVFNLANNLLDLVVFIEIHLGSGYATRLVAAVKLWLPDIVLASGPVIFKHAQEGKTSCSNAFAIIKICYPSWPSIVAKIELREFGEVHNSEENDIISEAEEFSTFKKLTETMILMLRANSEILDATGLFLFTGVVIGLEKNDFGLVFGLVHFICMKLTRQEHSLWAELPVMLASLHEIYPQIDRAIAEQTVGADGREKLLDARAMLELVLSYHMNEPEGSPMMDED